MASMAGNVVLITGGSAGIGLATAEQMLAQGARVYLLARNEVRLRESAARLSGDVRVLVGDLADPTSLTAALRRIEAADGRLEVLVNSAGQLELGPADQLSVEVAERLMQINYLGTLRMTHLALPLLRAGRCRSVVNVASIAGLIAPPFMAAYAASKFALVGYTRALRQELAAEGFHVGLVCPGPVATAMIEGRIHAEHYRVPRGTRILTPAAVATEIIRMVRNRRRETLIPHSLGAAGRLAGLWPGLVDAVYASINRQATPQPEK